MIKTRIVLGSVVILFVLGLILAACAGAKEPGAAPGPPIGWLG